MAYTKYMAALRVVGLLLVPGVASAASVTSVTVPVPAAAWLFGSALGLLVIVRRKFKAETLAALGAEGRT